jgi:hypothetical protein
MDEKQLAAWLARGHRAMKDTVPPRTRKQFAALMLESRLWSPGRLSMESAIARVGDCLNPQGGGNQHFRFSELWLWMKESGHHALFDAMADDLGYATQPIPTEARQQEMLARIDGCLAALADEFGKLNLLRAELVGTQSPDSLPPPSVDVPVRFSRGDDCERGF